MEPARPLPSRGAVGAQLDGQTLRLAPPARANRAALLEEAERLLPFLAPDAPRAAVEIADR